MSAAFHLQMFKETDVLGDRKAIFSTISIKQPSEAKQLVMSCNMRAIDSISFLSDAEALVEGAKQCLESELVDINSNDICQILDCHASLTTRHVRDHPSASWLNDTVRTAWQKQRGRMPPESHPAHCSHTNICHWVRCCQGCFKISQETTLITLILIFHW